VTTLFKTTRLIVRQFWEEDKDDFFQLTGSEEVMRYIRPPSKKEDSDRFLTEIIADYLNHRSRGRWAVVEKETKKLIGTFAIIPIPSQPAKTQLGYSFIPPEWGKGYATELAKAGLAWFFSHDPSPVIYGVTEVANVPSQQVLLKAGFKTNGSFLEEGKDLLLFAATRS
jgi:ribosomal-protein-alanine N-acetyltransferase